MGKKNSATLGCYSGDIRHRPGACAEYIDIKLPEAYAAGYKYAILDIHNFNGRSLESVQDCVVGVHGKRGCYVK